tara:strand:- start:2865 stop:3047 length:183 start_codon:yes stop_codon:yes gene_type:complete
VACDRNLSDFESTRKSRETGEYLDLCNKCFNEIQNDLDEIQEREDLRHDEDTEYSEDLDE